MELLSKIGKGYETIGEDTLVSSTESPDRREGIGFYNTDDKLRVYYVVIGDDVSRGQIRVAAQTKIVDTDVTIDAVKDIRTATFNAYGDGRFLKATDNFAEAIRLAYENMGTVRYKGRVIYNRSGTVSSRLIEDYADQAGQVMEDFEEGKLYPLTGISVRQTLYFVSAGHPVLAFTDAGEPCIIYYYDRQQVSLYYPKTRERAYPLIEDAELMFENGHNDFLCSLSFE